MLWLQWHACRQTECPNNQQEIYKLPENVQEQVSLGRPRLWCVLQAMRETYLCGPVVATSLLLPAAVPALLLSSSNFTTMSADSLLVSGG